jgi:fatty acid desaturase
VAVAPRADPAEFFGSEEWRALTARSRWRGLWLVAHCWGVIGLAMLLGTLWPVTIPLAVLVIGTRQLGLFILMHDAAHGLLHPNRRINDAVAPGSARRRWANTGPTTCSTTATCSRPRTRTWCCRRRSRSRARRSSASCCAT